FFSFIIATYQRKDIVTETIRNVLKQRFTDFEIVMVDDGSTDGTSAHLSEIFKEEARLRIITQPNRERGAARNTGIRSATGTYLIFMDSDDRIDEQHLSVLYDCIVRENHPDFLTTKFDFLRNDKHIPTPVCSMKEGYYDYKILLKGNILGMYSCVKRQNPDLKLFEDDRKYAILEDWMFNLSNLRHSNTYLIDAVTYHIVDHPERSMTANPVKVAERMREASKWILENVDLDAEEKYTLNAYSVYFSAMNCLQANDRKNAWIYLRKGIAESGFRINYLRLIIRLLLGNRIMKLTDRKR
ncbi:MAG: hypothetical protein RL021_1429, partial [Bacteroidota bacterium]